MLHNGVPRAVEDVIHAMPHDAHPMAIILTGLCALSGCHPEQNPALAGQNVYKSREVQDQQIARLIGKVCYSVVAAVSCDIMRRAGPRQLLLAGQDMCKSRRCRTSRLQAFSARVVTV
eukprot:GHRQ01020357.1.p1 GENE.GHRQ01020357.1~~GHRQ01020357.1.p1  ORF type:complete len:118 (-),score=33.38 GHRQ01020357.1:156-509(-)